MCLNHPISAEPVANRMLDDVRDMYRRATGEELVVEGLREDQQLAQE